MQNKVKIGVIDFDSIIYSSFYGNKVADEVTGEPKKVDGKFVIVPKTDDEIKATLDGIMYHICKEGEFTHYVGFVKGKDTIKDRLSINPDYKQQRTKEIPEKWEFTKQYAIERWNIIEVNDIEVDDAVRITYSNIPDSHIVAIDKDLLNLAGTHFNWRKNEWVEVSDREEEEYLSKSLIVGDTVDNLKGIPGKGEAYCKKNDIRFVWDAFKAYIIELGLSKGVEEFYKNFKCLYILEHSDKFKIPSVIPLPILTEKNNDSEISESRSSSREIQSS